jgi:predicted PurR-regulated permease PerM
MDGKAGDAPSVSAGTDPSQAAVPDPAPAGMPEWVGRAVWRGIWQLIAAVLLTAAALWFAGRASDLIRYLILAQLLAFALEPAVYWLHQRRGWRRGSATGLLLVAILLLFVVLGVGMGAVLADQVDGLAEQLPVWIDNLNAFTQQHFDTTVVSSSSAAQSEQATQQVNRYLQEHAGDLLGAAGSLVGAVFSLFTVGLFTFYFTANGPQIRRVLCSRMPPERQRRVLWAYNTAMEKTGGYLYSRALLALINGGLMFLTLKLLGVPYALALGLFVGVVAAFIPIVGTYIAGAVPVLVALAAVSLTAAVIVLLEVLAYQQLENIWLSPRLSQKTMELNAGVAFAAAMAGGAVGGFIGAFFALPIAAVIQAFLSTYSRRYDVQESDLTQVDTPKPPKDRAGK